MTHLDAIYLFVKMINLERNKKRTNEKENVGTFRLPELDLLADPKNDTDIAVSRDFLEKRAHRLEDVLAEYGINGKIVNVRPGPVVTLFEFELALDDVVDLADDIARSMEVPAVRVASVPVIDIEMPNNKRADICLKEMLVCDEFQKSGKPLLIALGKDIGGKPAFTDLAEMSGLLIAGTTGSGKSVALHAMILSLVYRLTPEQVRLILIDPKMLEFSAYDGIPHLLIPVINDPEKALLALNWVVRETDQRSVQISELGVCDIDEYNKKVSKPLPHIVVIVDEMADLMLTNGKKIEVAFQHIAQKAKAVGIHLVMATQRPSADVITDTIKANFPERISFRFVSKTDSIAFLGEQGAEQLLGRGDMLYMAQEQRSSRLHGTFVSDAEVEAVAEYLRSQKEPEYEQSVMEEAL